MPLRVHVPSLAQARLGFTDRVVQQYDVKTFDTDKVPARSLAVARCGVEFTEDHEETPAFDPNAFETDGFLVSSTGQLAWKEGKDASQGGYFTIDTPGTQAVVGCAENQKCRLGSVTITPQCRFAALYVTALDRDKTIRSSKRLLVVALARARNTGMKLNAAENEILERGEAPILMEPVKATLSFSGSEIVSVNVLDHDGRRTSRTLPVTGRRFTVDGTRDKTLYYEVVVE